MHLNLLRFVWRCLCVMNLILNRIQNYSSVVPVIRNVEGRSATKNYFPISLLSAVSKVFENNRINDHLEKCGLFSDFLYRFRSS